MTRTALLLAALLVPALSSAEEYDVCEGAKGCRAMTPAEEKKADGLLKTMEGALPKPDKKWEVPKVKGMVDLTTGQNNDPMFGTVRGTCYAFKGGCYPLTSERSKLFQVRGGAKIKDLAGQDVAMDVLASGLRIAGFLRPTASAPCEVTGDAFELEKTDDVLVWQLGDNQRATVSMIFGARTCNEAEMKNLETPAPKELAQPQSVLVEIDGPTAVVQDLAKKVNRKALLKLVNAK